MAAASLERYSTSRPLLDEFTKFLHKTAMEIVCGDVEQAIFLLIGKGRLLDAELNEISRIIKEQHDKKWDRPIRYPGLALISSLKQNCLLSLNNLDLLIELLNQCSRFHLVNDVKEVKDSNVFVHDFPRHQVIDRVPTGPSHYHVQLVIRTRRSNFSHSKINDFKSKFQDHLDLKKPSMVVYLRCDDLPDNPGFSQAEFQLYLTDVGFNTLRDHATCWLLELSVVKLKIDRDLSVCLEDKPELQRKQSILGGSELHDSCKLDVILVIEKPFFRVYPVVLEKILKQCKKAIKSFQTYHDNIRVAQLYFGNHEACSSGKDTDLVQGSGKLLSNINDMCEEVADPWPIGGREGASGMADVMENVVGLTGKGGKDCLSDRCLRREASKVCIVIKFLQPVLDTCQHYMCPHGHDPIQLCNQMAIHALPLYVIGVPMTKENPRPPAVDGNDCFLTGLTAIGGGKFIPLDNVTNLAQVVKNVVKETASVESLMGTVNDLVISEVARQYGDVNIEHLARLLQTQLKKRQCTVNCISTNDGPTSQLAQLISFADNMQEVAEMMERWTTHHRELESNTSEPVNGQHRNQAGEGITLIDVEMNDISGAPQAEMKSVVGFLENQEINLECAFQMVRRQIHRSAYYRPM